MIEEEHLRELCDAASLLALLQSTIRSSAMGELAGEEVPWRGMELTVKCCRDLIQSTSDKLMRSLYDYESKAGRELAPSRRSGGASLAARVRPMPGGPSNGTSAAEACSKRAGREE